MWGSVSSITAEQSADIMAFFFAAGYFEPRGDARRGETRFARLRCSKCHSLDEVTQWKVVTSPLELLSAMWSHAPQMSAALEKRDMAWPSLSADDMSDLLAFIAAKTTSGDRPLQASFGNKEQGGRLFRERNCAMCHTGDLALNNGPFARSLTETAAALWNHAPMLTQAPEPLDTEAIASLVGYLWSLRYFDESGNATRGARVFAAKGCGTCHGSSPRNPISAVDALRAVWQHAPGAKTQNSAPGIWPRFLGAEFPDVVAFWNSALR